MTSEKEALDLSVQITTPENIRFDYRIAGPFRRLGPLILDFVIRVVVIVGLWILAVTLGVFSAFAGLGGLGGAMVGASMVVFYFILTWFYGLFFEAWMNGQTPGKRIFGLRVISVDGRPINAIQATIRNFLRVADTAPVISLEALNPEFPPAYIIPTFLVAVVTMSMTKRFQRIGDLAAGTMVVVDERNWYPKNAQFEDSRVISLSEFIPASFRMSRSLAQAIALYIDRRRMLSSGRRLELASALGDALHRKFGFRSDTSPDLTLCALYYRDFVATETAWSAGFGSKPSPFKAEPNIVGMGREEKELSNEAERSRISAEPPSASVPLESTVVEAEVRTTSSTEGNLLDSTTNIPQANDAERGNR